MSHGHRELAPLSRWLALSRMSRSARSKGEAREEPPCAATGADHTNPPADHQQKGPRHAQRLGLTPNRPPRRPPAEGTTPRAATGADHQPTPPPTTSRKDHAMRSDWG